MLIQRLLSSRPSPLIKYIRGGGFKSFAILGNPKNLHATYKMSSSSALIILADDAEEMETVVPADVLRRAGISVTLAGLSGSGPVRCSRNVTLVPDSSLDEAVTKGPYGIVIIPGGKGAQTLCSSDKVGSVLKDQENRRGFIAAICAGPTVLMSHGIGAGKKITSHPGVTEKLVNSGMFSYCEDRVVTDGKIITSRGPGSSFEFALAIVKEMKGQACVDEISPPMMLNF